MGDVGGRQDADTATRYDVGHRVRVRTDNPSGHTRAPAYVRGRPGVVESVRGSATLPDSAVPATGESRQEPVYAVRFEMAVLWGADAEPGSELVLELWESYLEPDAAAPTGGSSSDERKETS